MLAIAVPLRGLAAPQLHHPRTPSPVPCMLHLLPHLPISQPCPVPRVPATIPDLVTIPQSSPPPGASTPATIPHMALSGAIRFIHQINPQANPFHKPPQSPALSPLPKDRNPRAPVEPFPFSTNYRVTLPLSPTSIPLDASFLARDSPDTSSATILVHTMHNTNQKGTHA